MARTQQLPNTENLSDEVLRRRISAHDARIRSLNAREKRRELSKGEKASRVRAGRLVTYYEDELYRRAHYESSDIAATTGGVEVKGKDNSVMDLVREVHNDSDFRVARAEFHLEIEDELPFGVAVQVDIIAGAMEEIVAIVQGMLDERQKQEGGDDAE